MKGDTVDINLPYVDYGYRITFFGDEIEEIETLETSNRQAHEQSGECCHLSCQSYTLLQKI